MDELLQQIKQSLDDQYRKGYEDGWNAVWNALEDFLATEDAVRAARRGVEEPSEDEPSEPADVVETPATDSEPPASAERRLTPAQQRALDYITEHRGLTSKQLHGIGKGVLYGLAKAGVLANIDGRFYPAEHAIAEAEAIGQYNIHNG